MKGGIADAVVSLATAAGAWARVFDRPESVQLVNAETRREAGKARRKGRWVRQVRRAANDLEAADRRDDVDGMTAAVIELMALGITREDIEEASEIADFLRRDG